MIVGALELKMAQHLFVKLMDASWLLCQIFNMAMLLGTLHVLRLSAMQAYEVLAFLALNWVYYDFVALLAFEVVVNL
jgi:hypothetical protein